MKEKQIIITLDEDSKGNPTIKREFKGMNKFEVLGVLFDTMQMVQNSKEPKPVETTPEETTEKLLTVQEAAKFLHLSVPTMYGKVSKREIPYMKRSKRLYFSTTDLIDYVKKGKVEVETR